MIELYRKNNLIIPYAKLPINTGNIRGERNGYHNLSFTVLNRYLKEHQIKIDHNTIFKVGNLYYAQASGGSNDSKLIASNFTAELLQIQVMMFRYIEEITLIGTTLSSALAAILEGTMFTVGACEGIGTFDFQVTNTNAQQALAELIKQTGTEVKYEGLSISLKNNQYNVPTTLKKGIDFTTLDENTDTSDVITKVHFKNRKGDITGTVTSEHASKYNFERETYQEFEGDTLEAVTAKAKEYLATADKPRVSLSVAIPKIKGLSLELCQVVRLHNTLLNQEVDYKVVGYSKSLTKEDDTYQLGERKKDFADIQEIVTQEVQSVAPDIIVEVVEKEVFSAKTAHILNAWVRDLNVEYLETNFEALDARKPPPFDNVRNFIRIEDEKIHYITQTLSTTEFEDYKNKDGYQIYYTAINDNPQAYRYFTLTDPTSIYSDLTLEQVDAFKVKVRKVLSESVKASFEFGDTDQNTPYPKMVWGTGTDSSGTTDNGKGFIFKGLDGLVLRYVTSTGKTHEIKLGEKGIEGLPQGGAVGGEVPSCALTALIFFEDGILAEFGSLKKKWWLLEGADGTLSAFYDLDTGKSIQVYWAPDMSIWEV